MQTKFATESRNIAILLQILETNLFFPTNMIQSVKCPTHDLSCLTTQVHLIGAKPIVQVRSWNKRERTKKWSHTKIKRQTTTTKQGADHHGNQEPSGQAPSYRGPKEETQHHCDFTKRHNMVRLNAHCWLKKWHHPTWESDSMYHTKAREITKESTDADLLTVFQQDFFSFADHTLATLIFLTGKDERHAQAALQCAKILAEEDRTLSHEENCFTRTASIPCNAPMSRRVKSGMSASAQARGLLLRQDVYLTGSQQQRYQAL